MLATPPKIDKSIGKKKRRADVLPPRFSASSLLHTGYVMDSVKQLSSAADVKLNLSWFDIEDSAVAIWDRLAHFLKQRHDVRFENRSSRPHSPREGRAEW